MYIEFKPILLMQDGLFSRSELLQLNRPNKAVTFTDAAASAFTCIDGWDLTVFPL